MVSAFLLVYRYCSLSVEVTAGKLCRAFRTVLDEAGNNIAAFGHQDIIGAAGGSGIHEVNTDTQVNNGGINAGVREYQAAAGADDDEFGFE